MNDTDHATAQGEWPTNDASVVLRIAFVVLLSMAAGVTLFVRQSAEPSRSSPSIFHVAPDEAARIQATVFISQSKYEAFVARLRELGEKHQFSVGIGWTTVRKGQPVERIARRKINAIREQIHSHQSTPTRNGALIFLLLDKPRIFSVGGLGTAADMLSASVLYQPEFHHLQTRLIKDGDAALFRTIDFIDNQFDNINSFVAVSPLRPSAFIDGFIDYGQSITEMLPTLFVEYIQRIIIALQAHIDSNWGLLIAFPAIFVATHIFVHILTWASVRTFLQFVLKQSRLSAGYHGWGRVFWLISSIAFEVFMMFLFVGFLSILIYALSADVISRITFAQVARLEFAQVWNVSEMAREIDLTLPLPWRIILVFALSTWVMAELFKIFRYVVASSRKPSLDGTETVPPLVSQSGFFNVVLWIFGVRTQANVRYQKVSADMAPVSYFAFALFIAAIVALPTMLFFCLVPLQGPLATLIFLVLLFEAMRILPILRRPLLARPA